MTNSKPKLAVIGTGIAGLSTAWLMKQRFEVTVYESQPQAGMGVHTIDYNSNGIESRIDIPLRIFCQGYYDNLMALYREIGVEVLASDHAGIFTDSDGKTILHYGNADWGIVDFVYPKFDSLFNPNAWKFGIQSRRFFGRANTDLQTRDDLSSISFGEYLISVPQFQEFAEIVLLPMMSVTCTCNYQSVLSYPADIMLEYLTCGVHELGIMSAANGVDDIVPRLLEGVKLKTGNAVEKIENEGDSLSVATSTGDRTSFDQVVVAAQAQQAAKMIHGFNDRKTLLEAIPFEKSVMSVHTDTDILPYSKDSVSPVSYYLPKNESCAEVSVDLTKAIPRLRGQGTIFQTWNPIQPIAANKELARVEFTRPTVTKESRIAVAKLRKHHQEKENRLWLCGSYLADKIPLLEAAVDSSVAIAERLGATIPWKKKVA